MQITVKIDTEEKIIASILKQLKAKLNSAFRRAEPAIRRRIGFACGQLIAGTPEYTSMLSGELLGELGIPDVNRRLKQIIETVGRSVLVETIPVVIRGNEISGGMVARMLRSDFQDILSLAAGKYVSQPSGSSIDWLSWMITEGDKIIVFGYDVKAALSPAQIARSRTGKALMTKGSGWRVPPEFSGTLGNNFLTRAFNTSAVESLLTRIFYEEITGRL